MRFWFDTEFAEDGHTIELISVGVVAEDGREFYAVSSMFDPNACNDWVKGNVLPLLPPRDTWLTRGTIRKQLLEFVGTERPEFWAYYADYDWVVLCQLFGRMIDLPKGWPMFCLDIKQLAWQQGNPQLPAQTDAEHDALADARWNRRAWQWLIDRDAED